MLKLMRTKWRSTTIGRSARVLSRNDQQKISIVVIFQLFLGLLDLAGVAAIGMLGSLAVRGVSSQGPGDRVEVVLRFLHLSNQSFQTQAAILGCLAAGLLISRTILSVIFARRTLYFLSRRGARISSSLISKLLSQDLLNIQKRTTQETLYAVTRGVDSITLGVIGISVTLISDISLLAVMTIGLLVVDPVIAMSTVAVFGFVGWLLYRLLNQSAKRLGLAESNLTIANNEKIVEVLNSYRESVVRNRRYFYAKEIEKTKFHLADTLADIAFLPSISKYVIESTVVLGTLIISASQFLLQDASHAVATLSVFMAASTRIAPAVMRIQQGTIGIRQSLGSAGPTLTLIESLEGVEENSEANNLLETEHTGFIPTIEIRNLSLTYPQKQIPALDQISLSIDGGSFVAIVGPSGAGKTSLVDVLLGVLYESSGTVLISGSPPLETIARWPGAIAYVPQDVAMSSGTIKENITLGFPDNYEDQTLIDEALRLAQLSDFIESLPQGLDTQVGERGTKLSGGQRQRLGIARAMFTKPKLLVLDEATSALDGQTESDISNSILELKGNVTVVMIAHRLSTVRFADLVVYIDGGKIIAQGSFEQVRLQVPNFEKQAQLMGL
ncbi:ABC transporter ATP-binding protein [Candidatus Planktophila dulcis]|uniref:ABC transporter ATP-binding protein n=1 Tax=Candidatus Planktophila dulcis TaxID=1884914 RepID=UPI003CE6A270